MRDWRKLWSSVVSSERLAKASFESRWLFTLLTAAQDDEGRYPWTPTMIRTLVASTKWTVEEATACRDELASLQMIAVCGDVVTLRKGKELNGNPRPDKGRPFLYPLPDDGPSLDGIETVHGRPREEESREEESREDRPGTVPSGNRPAAASSDSEPDPLVARIMVEAEQALGMISGIIAQKLLAEFNDLKESVSPECAATWMIYALHESVLNNARSFKYVQKILDTAQQKGNMGNGPPHNGNKPSGAATHETKPLSQVLERHA